MKYTHVAVGILFLAVTVIATAPAGADPVAQVQNNTTVQVETPQPTGDQIEPGLKLISSSYDESAGTATIVVYAEVPKAVTIADAGMFVKGGLIPERTIVADGRTQVTISVTEVEGFVGVTVAGEENSYAVPMKVDYENDIVPGSPGRYDTLLVGSTVFVLFAVALPTSFYLNRKMRGKEHDQH